MNLFLNALTDEGILFSFDGKKCIKNTKKFSSRGQESFSLPTLLDSFIKKHLGGYNKVENIVVVVGPGSFTGIRAITLIVNTLSFIFPGITLTPISFFELYPNYPVIKASSKKDVFALLKAKSKPVILTNENFIAYCKQKNISVAYGENLPYIASTHLKLENKVEYATILSSLKLRKEKIVSPLYLKKPNIS